MKIILFLPILITLLISCSENTKAKAVLNENDKIEVDSSTPPQTPRVKDIIQEIDATTTSKTAEEFDITVMDIHECTVEDYGQKKHIFCFSGGLKAHKAVVYYTDKKPLAGIYTIEKYNASPADIAAYDESKTIKKQAKIYFKDGNLDRFVKIVDMNDAPTELDEEQKKDWNILTAAIPPF